MAKKEKDVTRSPNLSQQKHRPVCINKKNTVFVVTGFLILIRLLCHHSVMGSITHFRKVMTLTAFIVTVYNDKAAALDIG